MQLHDPWALLLLALLPLVARGWHRPERQAAVRFPTLGTLRNVQIAGRRRWYWVLPALRVIALVLLVVGLARPQRGRAESRYTGEGIDIMLAVDISGSMLAEDFTLNERRVNRLDAVKDVVRQFVEGRPNDRIGLVLFGARAYTQSPLTLDHGWLLGNLDRARIGMIEDGTAIGSALATAAARLRDADGKSKVLVLLTDGQNNAGKVSPSTAADAVRATGIKTYTIGAGTRGLAPYPARDLFGNTVYQRVQVDIDETTLQAVAEKTGGKYFRATDTASLKAIYDEIDRMERTTFTAPRYLDYDELYPWLAIPALLLFAVEIGLGNTLLRKLP
ncbi:VWA domain-containing protein [Candidatus Binatia bacterium]|nr:VWA domain-containing protein [Candidatus Binatia bacterium]